MNDRRRRPVYDDLRNPALFLLTVLILFALGALVVGVFLKFPSPPDAAPAGARAACETVAPG